MIISNSSRGLTAKALEWAKGVVAEGGCAEAVLVNRNNILLTVVNSGELS